MVEDYEVLLKNIIKNEFGYEDYKNNIQKNATEAIYKGGRDVYICMPSGFGKSLCFYLPVCAKKNSFAIIVTPTIALAYYQANYLGSKNIKAYYWNACTPNKMKMIITNNMISSFPKMKFVLITPEQFESLLFQKILRQIKPEVLSYIVFDEAHSLSLSSHNFKPSYKSFSEEIRQIMPANITIVAVTSTATYEVQDDILNILEMNCPLIYTMPIYRSNLYYDLWYRELLHDPLKHLKQFIEDCLGPNLTIPKENKNCGIIFCKSQEETVALAKSLTSVGIKTVCYHNCLKVIDRLNNLQLWISGDVNVIIATSSFGTGISKPSVRFVVHMYIPQSIGNYYQESGRAGHDGYKSYCRIYCDSTELNTLNSTENKLFTSKCADDNNADKKIKLYNEVKLELISTKCRHIAFANYFGDPPIVCKNYCDICTYTNSPLNSPVIKMYKDNNVFHNTRRMHYRLHNRVKTKLQLKIIRKLLHTQEETTNTCDVSVNDAELAKCHFYMHKKSSANFLLDKIKKLLYNT